MVWVDAKAVLDDVRVYARYICATPCEEVRIVLKETDKLFLGCAC